MNAFVILNPHSGGGRVARHDLVARAEAAGARTHLLAPGEDLAAVAAKAADAGADVLGMAGGDGSLATVARVAADRDLPFLCLPAGTLNHFARDAGLEVDDPGDTLRALADGREKRVDLGELNDEHAFVNLVSLGLYAEMVADPAYRHDKGRVARDYLAEALAQDRGFPVTLPDGTTLQHTLVMLVSNNPYQFARWRWNAERFRLDGGRLGLSVIALPPVAARRRGNALASVVLRGRDRSEFWREWTGERWEQDFGGSTPVAIDGEATTVEAPLRLRIRPGAVRLLVPADVPDERPHDGRLASRHSATYFWHSLRRWIRVTRG